MLPERRPEGGVTQDARQRRLLPASLVNASAPDCAFFSLSPLRQLKGSEREQLPCMVADRSGCCCEKEDVLPRYHVGKRMYCCCPPSATPAPPSLCLLTQAWLPLVGSSRRLPSVARRVLSRAECCCRGCHHQGRAHSAEPWWCATFSPRHAIRGTPPWCHSRSRLSSRTHSCPPAGVHILLQIMPRGLPAPPKNQARTNENATFRRDLQKAIVASLETDIGDVDGDNENTVRAVCVADSSNVSTQNYCQLVE